MVCFVAFSQCSSRFTGSARGWRSSTRVHAVPVRKEIICVDDCSTDGTRDMLQRMKDAGRIDKLVFHDLNRGKGAAIRTALSASTGNVVIVQDADLEYDPADWPTLSEPNAKGWPILCSFHCVAQSPCPDFATGLAR